MELKTMLAEYRRFRSMSKKLNSGLVESLSRDDVRRAARGLGLLHGKQIELQTDDELCVLYDFAIHEIRRDGSNAVDRLLRDKPPVEGSDELRLLRALQQSHHAMLEITECVVGYGVKALDGANKTPLFLMDIGFSQTTTPGTILSTRIASPVDGWWMTTGAALPLNDEAVEIFQRELKRYARSHPNQEMSKRDAATLMIKACLVAGGPQEIVYGNVP